MPTPNLDELKLTADLFNSIAQIVTTTDQPRIDWTFTSNTMTYSGRGPHGISITINHDIKTANISGISVDFRPRPVMFKLLSLFLESKSRELTRNQLLPGLYNIQESQIISYRYRRSAYSNSLKMLSRLRRYLTVTFRNIYPEIRWIVFDPTRELWHLYDPNFQQGREHPTKAFQ